MKGQVLLLCSLNNGTVAIMFYYCTPLRYMEEPGESTWDASLVSRAWRISISSAPGPLAMMGITTPWLTCLQSSAVSPVLLVPCPRGCNASSITRPHVCFLGTSFLHTHRETFPTGDLYIKWLTRKERCLPAFFFFPPLYLSLNPILSKGVFMLEMFSGKEISSTIPCCCCFGKLHPTVPASARVTWPCCQHLVREAWRQLSISPWGTGSPRAPSTQTL